MTSNVLEGSLKVLKLIRLTYKEGMQTDWHTPGIGRAFFTPSDTILNTLLFVSQGCPFVLGEWMSIGQAVFTLSGFIFITG